MLIASVRYSVCKTANDAKVFFKILSKVCKSKDSLEMFANKLASECD